LWWAHSDRTPFGTGQPYSASQLKNALREHGFLIERLERALYFPAAQSTLLLSLADFFEGWGEKLCPALGGLLVAEVGRQLYAPLLSKTRAAPRRLILPLPLPIAPVPAGV
jgi:hypothetical protein